MLYRHIVIAILNGGFREYVLVKLGGLARPLSGIILSVCIFIVAYLLIPKIKNCVKRDYIFFGVMWFILTNLFDLSAYIKEGEGFAGLLQSYNIFTGNTWLLVVVTALIAPIIVMKIKEKRMKTEILGATALILPSHEQILSARGSTFLWLNSHSYSNCDTRDSSQPKRLTTSLPH